MAFRPENIPNLAGRVYLVTGGTAGLGASTIGLLAAHNPAHIYFTGRTASKADAVIAATKAAHPGVPLTFVECDNAKLISVETAARSILAQTDRLDVLIANAGVMALPPGVTSDGYEVQFGTNHLGHALLIKLLLPLMQKTAEKPSADVRLLLLSSIAYKQAPKEGIAFDSLKSPQDSLGGLFAASQWTRYGQSKLANLLYARALATRFPDIKTVAIHPGYIKTDLFAHVSFFGTQMVRMMAGGRWTPVAEGCYNQVWAATTPKEELEDGAYYVPVANKGQLETEQARDTKLADRLWDWTQEQLAPYHAQE